jgi:hypothetical protein
LLLEHSCIFLSQERSKIVNNTAATIDTATNMDTPTNMDAVNYVNDAANSTTDSDTHDSADMSSTANVHTVSGGMAHDNTVAITGHDGVLPSTSGSDLQPLCDLFYSQITANNAVIRIDGGVFRALKVHPGQAWLASQFR